ncbi:MAG: hypothetical protein HQM00_03395 [Magnetococcales bacterium]|nr:hypothetical protein [Magnetococcales bacterium]
MPTHHWPNDWFHGPGHYFWTSDTRLVDLELGYCANRQELELAVARMIDAGRERQEVGGTVYRTHRPAQEPDSTWSMVFMGESRRPALQQG